MIVDRRLHADLLADDRAHDQLEAGPRAGHAQAGRGFDERREPRIAREMLADGGRIGLQVEHAGEVLADRFGVTRDVAFECRDEASVFSDGA